MRSKLAIIIAALAVMLVPSSALAADAGQCPTFHLDQSVAAVPGCETVPHFKATFINRVWSFDGAVDAVDLEGHTLDMTTSGIENLPAQFASQDDPILDQDTHVLFGPKTKVFGPEGTVVSQDYLDYADSVVVRGKVMSPAKWAENADGVLVPTIRAKRIYIASYVDDGSGSSGDSSSSDGSTSDTSGGDVVQDPTPADGAVTTVDVTIWIELHVQIQR
jgi:hypothetical protein